MRTLLVDADSLIYAAASANEHVSTWDDDIVTLHGNLPAAKAMLRGELLALQEKLEADHVVLALSDYEDPWRRRVMPTYKTNRSGLRKPMLIPALREYAEESYVVFRRPGLEGDDVLGILLTAPKPPAPVVGERVCVSLDKDMGTVPGLHYNYGKPDLGVREVTLAAADRFHLYQTLTGDPVDGYAGCPGIGPKRAERVLEGAETVPEMWARVVAAYVKAGLGEEAALQTARVARICRASDYNFKTKEVRLWSPPT